MYLENFDEVLDYFRKDLEKININPFEHSDRPISIIVDKAMTEAPRLRRMISFKDFDNYIKDYYNDDISNSEMAFILKSLPPALIVNVSSKDQDMNAFISEKLPKFEEEFNLGIFLDMKMAIDNGMFEKDGSSFYTCFEDKNLSYYLFKHMDELIRIEKSNNKNILPISISYIADLIKKDTDLSQKDIENTTFDNSLMITYTVD